MTKKLSLDLDKDGVPDVVVEDTNGHSVYVNVKWLIAGAAGLVTTVVGAVMAVGLL